MSSVADSGELFRWIKGEIDDVSKNAVTFVENVIATGAQDARDYTLTRPSAKSGKTGRVETGLMADSFSSQMESTGPNVIRGVYGFLDVEPEYFVLQTETGFMHSRSGQYIAPTLAMKDAYETSKQMVDKAIADGKL